jgi:hypothetical protein
MAMKVHEAQKNILHLLRDWSFKVGEVSLGPCENK